jgi:hypothetical protein
VDVGLAAVVACDLDLVVTIFVGDLGACNVVTVSVVERGALCLLDVGSGWLRRRIVAGSISHACSDEQQQRSDEIETCCTIRYKGCILLLWC